MASKIHVKKDDTVVVLSGKDAGKKGKIVKTTPANGRVFVAGVNIVTKHQKAQGQQKPAALIKREGSIDASNVMLVVKGVPTRVGIKVEMVEKNGKTKAVRTRVAKAKELNGAVID